MVFGPDQLQGFLSAQPATGEPSHTDTQMFWVVISPPLDPSRLTWESNHGLQGQEKKCSAPENQLLVFAD